MRADVYYYRIGEGVENKGKFGGYGEDKYRSNTNRNTGAMKNGYPVNFERNKGGSRDGIRTEPAIKMVFPTAAAKESFRQNVRRAIYGN